MSEQWCITSQGAPAEERHISCVLSNAKDICHVFFLLFKLFEQCNPFFFHTLCLKQYLFILFILSSLFDFFIVALMSDLRLSMIYLPKFSGGTHLDIFNSYLFYFFKIQHILIDQFEILLSWYTFQSYQPVLVYFIIPW